MIADTSFLIDIMANKPGATAKAAALSENEMAIRITSISLFELQTGIAYSARRAQEEAKVRVILEETELLPFDDRAARAAGEIQGALLKDGSPIGALDAMIAGIAKARDEPVLTRNVKHFERAGVHVDTY